MQTSRIFGFDILSVSKKELFAHFDNFLVGAKSEKTQLVFTPNPEQIVIAKHDQSFAENLHKADWLLPDGVGLVCASALLKFFGKTSNKIRERIAGVEVVEHLLQKNLKTLIIGGRDYVGSFKGALTRTNRASLGGEVFENIKSLKKIQNNLYWTEAYQEKTEVLPIEEEALAQIITRLKPALVFVALGAPDQEKWILTHSNLLQANQVKIAMAVGGSFDFLFAKVARAPRVWQKMGLEWLWRLIKQPWRGKRQLRLIEFIYLLIKEII